VDAPEAVRRARLLASRGSSGQEADRMIAAQLSSAAKRPRSDYVIDNGGELAALERAAGTVWRALLARA
jgi:dephospho-CoA kinase